MPLHVCCYTSKLIYMYMYIVYTPTFHHSATMAEQSVVEVEITVELSEVESPQHQSTPGPPEPPPPPPPSVQPLRPQGLFNRGRKKQPDQHPSRLLTPSGTG